MNSQFTKLFFNKLKKNHSAIIYSIGSAYILYSYFPKLYNKYLHLSHIPHTKNITLNNIIYEYNPFPLLKYLILSNIFVYSLWKLSSFSIPLKHFLNNHFTFSYSNICKYKRVHTLLTPLFSHCNLMHLSFNIIFISSFSYSLIQSIGNFEFCKLFFGGGVCGTVASLLHFYFNKSSFRALGMSAGGYSILASICLLHPDSLVSIIFLPFFSFKLIQIVPFIVLLDIIGVIRGWNFFGHSAHLGGFIYGYIYFYVSMKNQGTKENGRMLLNMNPYIGPTKNYCPTEIGTIYTPKHTLKCKFIDNDKGMRIQVINKYKSEFDQ